MDENTRDMDFLDLAEDLPCYIVGEGGLGQFEIYEGEDGRVNMTCRAQVCCGEGQLRRLAKTDLLSPLTVLVDGRHLTFFVARECTSCGLVWESENFLAEACGTCAADLRQQEMARRASVRGSRTPPSEV